MSSRSFKFSGGYWSIETTLHQSIFSSITEIFPMRFLFFFPVFIFFALYFILFLQISRKFQNLPFLKRPQLHLLFLTQILAECIYLLSLSIYSFITPLSFQGMESGVRYSGYMLEFPSLFLGNLIVHIGTCSRVLTTFLAFFMVLSVRRGQKTAQKFLGNAGVWIGFGLVSALVLTQQQVFVFIQPDQVYARIMFRSFSLFGLFFIDFWGNLALILTFSYLKGKINDRIFARKRRLLVMAFLSPLLFDWIYGFLAYFNSYIVMGFVYLFGFMAPILLIRCFSFGYAHENFQTPQEVPLQEIQEV